MGVLEIPTRLSTSNPMPPTIMTTTTDTPRTDAVQFQPRPISMTIENEMLRALSRQLERELSALQRLRPTRDDVQKLEAEVERLRDAFSKLTDEIECTPWCTSHEAGRCDCKRLTRAYAISDSISQSPTK